MESAMKCFEAKIVGRSPLIVHNGQLADPLNRFAKRLKEISSTRKKTEQHYEEMANIEWEGSLYLDDAGRPTVPASVIDGFMGEAAKRFKLGKAFKSAVEVMSDPAPEFSFDGMKKSITDLWKDVKYRDTRGVKVGTSRVMRTRPKFNDWSLVFTIAIDTGGIKPAEIEQFLVAGGRFTGLCEMRPRYGKFTLEQFQEVELKD